MKIENAKKIEVWEFEDEGVLSYLLPEGVIWKNFDGYKSIKNKRHHALVCSYFAELEAKEQEEPTPYKIDGVEVKEWEPVFINPPTSTTEPKYVSKITGKTEFSLKEFDRAYLGILDRLANMVDANIRIYERLNKLEKSEKGNSTSKLLEDIHNLEKRIEDLEADRSTLVIRTNDIYQRLNSAKLSL